MAEERCASTKKNDAPPGGVEPPTFRLTAERANHCATEADGMLSLFVTTGDSFSFSCRGALLFSARHKNCIGRESNPGRPRGRRAFYH